MKLYFNHPDFNAQFIRAVQQTYSGGADIAECFATANKIEDGNIDSWFENWSLLAETVFQEGIHSESSGHFISARESYLRASNYYRVAMYFLYAFPQDLRFQQTFDRHSQTFKRAAELFPHTAEEIAIPFENSFLPGYFYQIDPNGPPRATIILNGGYDSTHQEMYCTGAVGLLRRGYNVVTFDGPGQGAALINNQLYMRPDWSNVLARVIDFISKIRCVNSDKIGLIGMSWGGLLAPLAATKEHRIAAMVVNPGQYEALWSLRRSSPEINDFVETGDQEGLAAAVAKILNNERMFLKMKSKMHIHGVESAVELIKIWKNFSLAENVKEIACPTLVIDTESEELSAGQAKKLYEELVCSRDYLFFTVERGADAHCMGGALSLFYQEAFDWLDDLLFK